MAPMKLLDLVEPAFLFVCRINRHLRNEIAMPYDDVRNEALGCLDSIRAEAGSDSPLLQQFEQVKLPLVFFIDSVMVSVPAQWAGTWASNRLAMTPEYGGVVAPNEKFFALLTQCRDDGSAEATERLAVFYTCLAFGFVGSYQNQAKNLQFQMQQIAVRLKAGGFIVPNHPVLFPDAQVNTTTLPTPVSETLTPLILCFVASLVLLGAFFIYRYHQDSAELYNTVKSINQSSTKSSPR